MDQIYRVDQLIESTESINWSNLWSQSFKTRSFGKTNKIVKPTLFASYKIVCSRNNERFFGIIYFFLYDRGRVLQRYLERTVSHRVRNNFNSFVVTQK